MTDDDLAKRAKDTGDKSQELAFKVLEILEKHPIPTVGVTLSLIISSFLVNCELSKPGGGKSSRELLLKGTDDLYDSMQKKVAELQATGVDVMEAMKTQKASRRSPYHKPLAEDFSED